MSRPHCSTVPGSIMSSGYCLWRVLRTLPLSIWLLFRFSSFLSPPKGGDAPHFLHVHISTSFPVFQERLRIHCDPHQDKMIMITTFLSVREISVYIGVARSNAVGDWHQSPDVVINIIYDYGSLFTENEFNPLKQVKENDSSRGFFSFCKRQKERWLRFAVDPGTMSLTMLTLTSRININVLWPVWSSTSLFICICEQRESIRFGHFVNHYDKSQ